MSDDLLPFYERELSFLRRMGAEFARAHPKVAGRLRLGPDAVEDPHVARLIESAAFLNARIRHKLEDDFPELTDAMLGVLYPHYLAPIPSMAVVQLECGPNLSEPYQVPSGTLLETDSAHGAPCRYRTCYPVTLYPIQVAEARLSGAPFDAPLTPSASTAVSALKLVLKAPTDGAAFADLAPGRLRFYLGGQPQHALGLYELLLNDVVEVALATSSKDSNPQILPASCLRPVGFAEGEGLLPYPKRSFLGYRLLTEYFAFPGKFLFLDLEGLEGQVLERARDRLEIHVYLKRSSVDLQQNVGPANFVLGCTPMVNLFPKRAEPVRLSQKEPEVRIVPDARRPLAMEVYSVDDVAVTRPDGTRIAYRPFYGIDHGGHGAHSDERPTFYQASRRRADMSASRPDEGTEVFLQFVDLDLQPALPADSILSVETTCLNRDLPGQLPFGGDQPRLSLSDGGGAIQRLRCLTAPTATIRPKARDGARWRLISHLSLNHLSLTDDEHGSEALKEILRLYEFAGNATNMAIIDSIERVSCRSTTMRVASGVQAGFCRGTEVTLHLNEARFADHGLFLFASVLEVFLGMYCSMNSYVQLVVTTSAREGELRRWPPRAGTGPLL